MTCRTLDVQAWPERKSPAADLRYEVDFVGALSRRWERGDWQLGDRIRHGGYDWEVTRAGRSGDTAPRFSHQPIIDRTTTPDGSAVFTAREPSGASLITTVNSFGWSEPAGLTVEHQVDGLTKTSVRISGGDLGAEYQFEVSANCANGEVIVGQPLLRMVGR